MTTFPIHTPDTAPDASRAALSAVAKAWGFVPKLQGTLAESPAALQGYEALFALVGQTGFTPQEAQVALLTVSVFHGCEYCTMGHTYLARASKAPEEAIQAVRNRAVPGDARLAALVTFTRIVLETRGDTGDAAVEAFLQAGFTRANVLDLLVIVAVKTISNYANHLTHTPKESFMSDPALAWVA
jgi:AhpD family alkylhydroperoxidase